MKRSMIGLAAVAAICLGGCDHGGDEAAAAATRAATPPDEMVKGSAGENAAGAREAGEESTKNAGY
jgi:hypothetical protein